MGASPTSLLPPLTPALRYVRGALIVLGILASGFILELLVVSPLQQRAAQQRAFDAFRAELATGAAPVAAGELGGRHGDPVAYLEVPEIGLRQVVVEGTDGHALTTGPGHRRDSPLPGQVGTSIVMGRRSGFGGPFARVDDLSPGSSIRVTTGAGVFEYRVRGVRRAGDVSPAPPRAGAGRLVLATADGRAFVPSGLLLVDADLMVPALGGPGPRLTAATLPDAEKLMALDATTTWRLILWMQVALVVVLAGIWAWHRWHRAKAWTVFLPTVLLVGLMSAREAALLLPNLL